MNIRLELDLQYFVIFRFKSIRLREIAQCQAHYNVRNKLFQEHFSVLRRLSYPDADVFMVCFSIIDPYSFKRIQTKWLKELSEYSPQTPIVLVGTKHDQRNNINTKILLNKHGLKPVTQEQGEQFARKIRARQVIKKG